MNLRAWTLLFCATSLALSASARPALASRADAREEIATGQRIPDAIRELAVLARRPDASLAVELSLALASSGLVSASLSEMDRALILDPTDDEVLYAGSTLLAWLGLTQAADELKRADPDWVKGPLPLLSRSRKRSDVPSPMGGFGAELRRASELMAKSRFVSALDRFARLTATYPREPLGWAGYAIALEKVGAYRTSARAVAMEVALDSAIDPLERAEATEHEKDLQAMPPLAAKKFNESLEGRYTAFAGGSLNGGDGASVTGSVRAQLGKFVTHNLNLSADIGYSSLTGFEVGAGERWYFALPLRVPLSLTAGSRVEFDSAPASGSGDVGLILSPGVSWFVGGGSLDLFVDFGVAGAESGTETLSLGYTFYFGGARVL